MLNPSTADGEEDDATIRKITKYSKLWGYDRLKVVNLFAWRATCPKDLIKASYKDIDVVGPRADAFIKAALDDCDRVICGWGSNAAKVCRGINRADNVFRMIKDASDVLPVETLGATKEGFPGHPLYLPGDRVPEPLNPAWEIMTEVVVR